MNTILLENINMDKNKECKIIEIDALGEKIDQ